MDMKEYSLSMLGRLRMQLWNGHAAIMVGSGFSCNADRISTSRPAPPDWLEFSSRLVSELYPGKSQDEIVAIAREHSPLALAQKYQVHFGRASLEDFVKRTIDDGNMEPNSIFQQLLDLPWTDVFTTNYDTLLERTARIVLNRKYDVVCSHQDLARTQKPRIIKLHGSLSPSPGNLIVTEEDYRTYPQKFAPFVNTIRQALMENSLCLVGFSGSDPNFKQWTGWVRDNLKEETSPIYLLSVCPVPESERDVLLLNNIHVVDLSCLAKDKDAPPNQKFKFLFEYLRDRPDKSEEWIPSLLFSGAENHLKNQTVDTLKELESMRKSYSQWLVMPWEQRESLGTWMELNAYAIADLEKLEPPWDIKGLYEINWCRERVLLPLLHPQVYQRVLKRYNPLDSKTAQDGYPGCKAGEIRQMWLELAFSVWRWHRENGRVQEWTAWDRQLAELLQNDAIGMNRLTYERVMMAFVQCNAKQVKDLMDQWGHLSKTPYWRVKHASVLFELGEEEKAVSELKHALEQIRNASKPQNGKDCELLSLEGSIWAALQLTDINSSPPNGSKNDEFKASRDRLKALEQLHCNPLPEADRFLLLLSGQDIPDVGSFRRRNFDTTIETIKTRNGLSASLKHAYQCARFLEESCLPLHVGLCITNLTNALYGCIRRLAPVAPDWAFSLLCRLGSKDDVDAELFFSQHRLAAFPFASINQYAENLIQQIRHLLDTWPMHQLGGTRCYHATALGVVLEVLSRMTCKVSDKVLGDIFDVGVMVAKSGIPALDIVAIDLFSKFFPRVVQAMQGDSLLGKMTDLLYLASPASAQKHRFWQNPFFKLAWHGFTVAAGECSKDLEKQIHDVIAQVQSEDRQTRSHAFVILDRLHDLGILSAQHLEQFGKNICCHMGQDGLPDFAWVYPHGYLTYLAPVLDRASIEKRVRSQYLKFDFKVHVRTETGWSFSDDHFSNAVHSMLNTMSILATHPKWAMSLTSADAHRLFLALAAGLRATNEEVQEAPVSTLCPGHGPRDVFDESIGLYDRVLGEVIVPHLDQDGIAEARTWFNNLPPQWNFPVSDLALHGDDSKHLHRIAHEIIMAFSTEKEHDFYSYLQAYANWCQLAAKGSLPPPPADVLRGLVDVVAMRTGNPFKRACSVLGQIAKDVKFTQEAKNILWGNVDRLLELTTVGSSSTRFPLAERVDFRKVVARLAGSLYHLHEKEGQPMPPSLSQWKTTFENPEELSPVRHAWADAIASRT